MTEITTNDWLAELERLAKETPEGFTTAELAARTGLTAGGVCRHIRAAVASGLMRFVGYRVQYSITGRPYRAPVYQVIKKGKKQPR